MEESTPSIWWRLVNLNPAIWRGVITALISVLLTLGVKFSPDLSDKILVAIPFVLALLQAVWTRSAVTPNAKVAVVVPDPVNEPAQVEAGQAVVPSGVPDYEIVEAAQGKGV